MKLSALELCAGAGGASLGLEAAGFTPAVLVDNDWHACATLRVNRPTWNTVQADVRAFDVSQWSGVDLVSGGLPCPPYSVAGQQLGADDERDLFPAMLRIVKQAKPRAVLIENVRGLLANRFNHVRAGIDAELSRMGFATYWTLLNAVHFGTPQKRSRTFLIALKRGATRELRWPFPRPDESLSVGAAIGDLMAENGWRKAPEWAIAANRPAPTIVGGSKKHGGPDLGPTRARREWAEMGVDGLGVANQAPAEDFEGRPRLTARMIARIQGFADDWTFYGSKTQQCRQIGNALPPPLARVVAATVAECLR